MSDEPASKGSKAIPVVVFDTGIVLAAAFNPSGVSMKTLRRMEAFEITVFISNRLRQEYEDLLRRPSNRLRYPYMTEEYIAVELDRFDTYAERIPNPPQVFAYPRDPNDESLINLAVAIQADYLVTLDNDLLSLPRQPEFLALPYQPRILKPGAFLDEIESAE